MTPKLDTAAIRARMNTPAAGRGFRESWLPAVMRDVPALCSEVDRLRTAITQALGLITELDGAMPSGEIEETLRAALGIEVEP